METPRSSEVSSPRECEPVMECHLVLNALSGTVVNISMSVAKFDRFEDLEDHVVDYLFFTRVEALCVQVLHKSP